MANILQACCNLDCQSNQCCESGPTECCMYPASQLGALYGAADLPDNVLAPSTPNQIASYTKSGSRFLGSFTPQNENTKEYEVVIATLGGNTGWTWREVGQPPTEGLFPCLFFQTELQVSDTFADTYTITTNQSSGVVTRQSLCFWSGVDNLGCRLELRYEDRIAPPLSGTRFKWTVNYAEGGLDPCNERAIAFKVPSQNTPIGSYSENVTVA